MILTKPATKSHYSESEAAAALGLSVDELRSLIRNHIVGGEEELKATPVSSFQPADVLLLKILVAQKANSSNAA